MKLTLILVGKTSFSFVRDGIAIYEKRILHYLPYERIEIPDIKGTASLSAEMVKEKEGEMLLKKIKPQDEVILLDEHGKEFSSTEWAHYLENKMITGAKNITFVIGGAYGFSKAVYDRADSKVSFSRMTFSHQIIRLFFTEQLYRAMTIIKGEPYHNE